MSASTTPAAPAFDYAEMTTRNAGFVTDAEQAALRTTPVFVCGVGGMGGAAVQSLARAGMERLAIADMDRFEVSNLNRQVFADMANVGTGKVEATVERLAAINPGLRPRTYGAEWTERLDEILAEHRIVVNGMDDLAADPPVPQGPRARRHRHRRLHLAAPLRHGGPPRRPAAGGCYRYALRQRVFVPS